MSDISFIHDFLLDTENQMSECMDLLCNTRYGINGTNAISRLKQIDSICEDIKSLAEELQEKAKKSLAGLK